MLTTLDCLLVLEVSGDGFQKDLLNHLPREQAEADQPVITQIVLLALPKDRSLLSSSPLESALVTMILQR